MATGKRAANGHAPDAIDAAIGSAGLPALQLVTIRSTGRQFGLPPQLHPREALEIAAFLIGGVTAGIPIPQPASGIVIPGLKLVRQ